MYSVEATYQNRNVFYKMKEMYFIKWRIITEQRSGNLHIVHRKKMQKKGRYVLKNYVCCLQCCWLLNLVREINSCKDSVHFFWGGGGIGVYFVLVWFLFLGSIRYEKNDLRKVIKFVILINCVFCHGRNN